MRVKSLEYRKHDSQEGSAKSGLCSGCTCGATAAYVGVSSPAFEYKGINENCVKDSGGKADLGNSGCSESDADALPDNCLFCPPFIASSHMLCKTIFEAYTYEQLVCRRLPERTCPFVFFANHCARLQGRQSLQTLCSQQRDYDFVLKSQILQARLAWLHGHSHGARLAIIVALIMFSKLHLWNEQIAL